jgi:hypothetical protein
MRDVHTDGRILRVSEDEIFDVFDGLVRRADVYVVDEYQVPEVPDLQMPVFDLEAEAKAYDTVQSRRELLMQSVSHTPVLDTPDVDNLFEFDQNEVDGIVHNLERKTRSFRSLLIRNTVLGAASDISAAQAEALMQQVLGLDVTIDDSTLPFVLVSGEIDLVGYALKNSRNISATVRDEILKAFALKRLDNAFAEQAAKRRIENHRRVSARFDNMIASRTIKQR